MKDSFSYSEWSTAVQCQRRYKLTHLDKLKPEGGESGDLQFGTALHLALSSTLEGLDGEEVFRSYWATYLDKELVYGRFNWEQLETLGGIFMAKFMKTHAHKYQPVLMEERLYGEYAGIKFEGTPDLVCHYDGKLTLVDFKTTAYAYKKEKIQVGIQLYLYAYLYMQTYPEQKIEQLAYLCFVKGTAAVQTLLTIPLDTQKMYAMLDDMVSYIRQMQPDYYPKNYNACIIGQNLCPYFQNCHGGAK